MIMFLYRDEVYLHHRSGDLESEKYYASKKLSLHHRSGDLEKQDKAFQSIGFLHHRSVITSTDKCIKHIRDSPKESLFRQY